MVYVRKYKNKINTVNNHSQKNIVLSNKQKVGVNGSWCQFGANEH